MKSVGQFRIERDPMGEVQIPTDAYYGSQTKRALDNFPISGIRFQRRFIRALGIIKLAAAKALSEGTHVMSDMATASILKFIKEGNLAATMFWLRTKDPGFRRTIEGKEQSVESDGMILMAESIRALAEKGTNEQAMIVNEPKVISVEDSISYLNDKLREAHED